MIRLCRRALTLLAILAVASCAPKNTVSITKDVTLIVIRHADRDAGVDALNATGLTRAAALPPALSDYEVDAIYSPGFHRNLETATPLANARDLEIQSITEFSMPEKLASLPSGTTAVWIGNKENLKLLWERTSAPGEPPLNYGELKIVRFDATGHAELQSLHFGPNG